MLKFILGSLFLMHSTFVWADGKAAYEAALKKSIAKQQADYSRELEQRARDAMINAGMQWQHFQISYDKLDVYVEGREVVCKLIKGTRAYSGPNCIGIDGFCVEENPSKDTLKCLPK